MLKAVGRKSGLVVLVVVLSMMAAPTTAASEEPQEPMMLYIHGSGDIGSWEGEGLRPLAETVGTRTTDSWMGATVVCYLVRGTDIARVVEHGVRPCSIDLSGTVGPSDGIGAACEAFSGVVRRDAGDAATYDEHMLNDPIIEMSWDRVIPLDGSSVVHPLLYPLPTSNRLNWYEVPVNGTYEHESGQSRPFAGTIFMQMGSCETSPWYDYTGFNWQAALILY